MKTTTAYDEDNLQVDQRLLAELKRLGIVQTQYDLSRLCGRNPSYFSSMMAKRQGLKLGSLMLLASRLRKRSGEVADARVGIRSASRPGGIRHQPALCSSVSVTAQLRWRSRRARPLLRSASWRSCRMSSAP